MPAVGDKLVCLQERQAEGPAERRHLDGGAARRAAKSLLRLDVVPEEDAGRQGGQGRDAPGLLRERRRGACPIRSAAPRTSSTYGYALTVHKAQGSQWDDVVLFDESWAFREHGARWLYTGITRAAETLTVVR